MPTYTYQCPECKKETDVNHGIMDEFLMYCGYCDDHPACVRIISQAPSFALKGKGWYKTDFK